MEPLFTTPRTILKRLPERGSQDRKLAYDILDEGLLAHVGFATDEGPFVIPMAYARDGNDILLHGSSVSRLLTKLASGLELCLCVTLLDGMVLARSVFHHSMNFRSVVVFGQAELITEPKEKLQALIQLVEHLVPGRNAEARQPNRKELNATSVLRVPLDEASIKVREGPPKDAKADLALPVWAGVLPLGLLVGEPLADEYNQSSVPDYVTGYRRGKTILD